MIVRSSCAAAAGGSPASRGSAALSGVTSSRSTKPGCEPSAFPVKLVPDRGEPTTKTSRSSRPSGPEAARGGRRGPRSPHRRAPIGASGSRPEP